jgi:sodium-dependent dicarboxylate transporter 2/3/5
MEQLQLVLLFATGFLISRVMVKTRLPQKLVLIMMGNSHNSLSLTLLYLLTTAATVSLFIPNAITMLTLLPVLDLLNRTFTNRTSKVPTMLTLAVLYGSNIGGMGSITGTPTNMVLVGYLSAHNVPGVENITFLSWLMWGIPLVIVIITAAWIILCVSFNAWQADAEQVHIPFAPEETEHPLQLQALGILLFYIIFAALLSYLLMVFPERAIEVVALTAIIIAGLTWYLFLYPTSSGRPFLLISDAYSDLPIGGLKWIAIVLTLVGLVYAMGIQIWINHYTKLLIPHGTSPFIFLLTAALITTFATEVLSNTMVQIAMFVVMLPIVQTMGLSPIQTLLAITLTCTCTFMTPIATPVNALAFGSTKDVSVLHFMGVGAIMNLVSALLITAYVLNFVNW